MTFSSLLFIHVTILKTTTYKSMVMKIDPTPNFKQNY